MTGEENYGFKRFKFHKYTKKWPLRLKKKKKKKLKTQVHCEGGFPSTYFPLLHKSTRLVYYFQRLIT